MASLRLFLAFLRFRSSVRSSLKPECVKDYDKLSEGMRRPAGSLCICSSFSLPFFQNSVFPPAVKLRRSMNDRISVGVAKNGSFSWNNLPVIDFKSTVKFFIAAGLQSHFTLFSPIAEEMFSDQSNDLKRYRKEDRNEAIGRSSNDDQS